MNDNKFTRDRILLLCVMLLALAAVSIIPLAIGITTGEAEGLWVGILCLLLFGGGGIGTLLLLVISYFSVPQQSQTGTNINIPLASIEYDIFDIECLIESKLKGLKP